MKGPRRQLLGKFALTDQLEEEYARSGMLEVSFSATRPDATVLSDDGNRTVAWVTPSGEIGALLVQDYANAETRVIPFAFGEIEIVNDGAEVSVFLRRPVGP